MMTAKVYEIDGCQEVQLPDEFRFTTSEVMINKVGDIVMLVPKSAGWNPFMTAVNLFSEDYLEGGRPAQGN